MKSLKGQLLLATEQMRGNEFYKTVVLICWHNHQGAFGLTLNRKTREVLGNVIATPLPEAIKDSPLYAGGPVTLQMLSILSFDPTADHPDEEDAGLPGLRISHAAADLEDMDDDYLQRTKLKFFAGYSGWAPSQLENEMKQDSWLTHPASIDHVFHPQPDKLWKSIMRSKGPECRLLADMPDDLSSN